MRSIAVKNVTVTRKSLNDWAKICLKDDGNCPYLDEVRLCEVHKRLGGEALSHTCSTYPRSSHRYKIEKFNTLTLSCPEVTRLVLLDPNAFNMHEETVNQQNYFNTKEINYEGLLINHYCNQLISIQNENIEENIYAINVFIHHLMNDVNQLEERMAMLSSAWSDRVMPLLNEHPHILRNFFQYCLYHNQFAINKTDEMDKDFYTYTIDYFIIKSVVSAFVIYNETLSDNITLLNLLN
ncbi:flagellin lysine-N-methylase [Yersinia aleksiciae]